MNKDQFPASSHEWTVLAKLDVATYEAELGDDMVAYRPECLCDREEQA